MREKEDLRNKSSVPVFYRWIKYGYEFGYVWIKSRVHFSGIGYGLVYLPSIVAVSQYFDKRRAFATGLGVSGAGIGTFIFSPITSILIKVYTWQGAILIQSGLVLNCIACGLVFRPINLQNVPSIKYEPDEKTEKRTNQNEAESMENTCTVHSENDECMQLQPLCDSERQNDETDTGKHSDHASLFKQNSNQSSICDYNLLAKGYINTSIHRLEKRKTDDRSSFDFHIFASIPFCMFTASTFFYSLGYYVPYIYLPDTAREAGIHMCFIVCKILLIKPHERKHRCQWDWVVKH